MSETNEVGFKLNNGMRISLRRPGIRGESVLGEHLDLIIEHPDGSFGRVIITCSKHMLHGSYVDFEANQGLPLRNPKMNLEDFGTSFQPSNMTFVGVSADGKDTVCSVRGVFPSFRLNLSPIVDDD